MLSLKYFENLDHSELGFIIFFGIITLILVYNVYKVIFPKGIQLSTVVVFALAYFAIAKKDEVIIAYNETLLPILSNSELPAIAIYITFALLFVYVFFKNLGQIIFPK